MDDLQIRSFKNEIIELMNRTNLPTEVKRLVLADILHETTKLVDDDIRARIKLLQEQEKNKKSEPENSPE